MAVVKSPYPNIQLLPDVDLVEFLLNSFDKYGRKTALVSIVYSYHSNPRP